MAVGSVRKGVTQAKFNEDAKKKGKTPKRDF
jgi:hypothetical protein